MGRGEQIPTLYDFIFVDYPRVKSLYSQLFSGLLSVIENIASQASNTARTLQAGGNPIGSISGTNSDSSTETKKEKMDPHDLILTDVLGELSRNNLISFKPKKAKPGEILLLQGSVSILDFGFYEALIDMLPTILKYSGEFDGTGDTFTNKKKRKQTEKLRKQQKNEAKNLGEMIKGVGKLVPWTTNILMRTDELTSWGAISKEYLRDNPSNLILKYGSTLSEQTWYMLGIVDIIGSPKELSLDNMPELINGLMTISNSIRDAVGRPDSFIGVTPLLIFRKLINE